MKRTLFVLIGLLFAVYATAALSHNHPFIEVTFDDQIAPNNNNKTVQVWTGRTNLPNINATFRFTDTSLYWWQVHYFIDGVEIGEATFPGGGVATTPYGSWRGFPSAHSNKCGSGAHYQCNDVHFQPNSTVIASLPLGQELKIVLNVRQWGPPRIDHYNTITYIREDLNLNRSSGSIVNNSDDNETFANQTADIKGYFNNESDLNFELWVKDGLEETEKFTLTKSEQYSSWSGTEWYRSTNYGQWYIQSFSSCPSTTDGSRCSQILFEPNSSAINQLYGKNVTMWLRLTKTVGNRSETEILKVDITGHPNTTFDWDVEGSESIETGRILTFNDIFGEATIFKKKDSAVTVDATERTSQSSLSFDNDAGNSELVGDFMAFPLGLDFKYGHWLVEEGFNPTDDPHNNLFHLGNRRFAFRPNTTAINSILNTDESIESILEFHIHERNNQTAKIHTVTITVTINRSSVKPILSIASKTSTVTEGNTATFTITSNVDPMQPFLVSYIPTNSKGDFLDSTTFPSGLLQIEKPDF